MPYDIENKLVIAVSSSALFDLSEADNVFRQKGEQAYREYQHEHIDDILSPGVAFPFIRRLLNFNSHFQKESPVEVVLLSRNDPDTGLRVFRSIAAHGLDITRAGFLTGKSPHTYLPAFNTSLFLSANETDVREAIKAGYPAGTVMDSGSIDDDSESELRIAFDFDGVIISDEAESVYKQSGDIVQFHQAETDKVHLPHQPGPLRDLLAKLSWLQKIEHDRIMNDSDYRRILRIAIVTARNAPSHERMVTTLRDWGFFADETFFMGGIDKSRVLKIMKPHIYFDDQLTHLNSSAGIVPSVHIPFGISNSEL